MCVSAAHTPARSDLARDRFPGVATAIRQTARNIGCPDFHSSGIAEDSVSGRLIHRGTRAPTRSHCTRTTSPGSRGWSAASKRRLAANARSVASSSAAPADRASTADRTRTTSRVFRPVETSSKRAPGRAARIAASTSPWSRRGTHATCVMPSWVPVASTQTGHGKPQRAAPGSRVRNAPTHAATSSTDVVCGTRTVSATSERRHHHPCTSQATTQPPHSAETTPTTARPAACHGNARTSGTVTHRPQ